MAPTTWLYSWLDENNLLVGEDLNRSLENAILTDCNFLVVLISNDAADSEWVRKEVAWAKKRQTELSGSPLHFSSLIQLISCSGKRKHSASC